MARFVPPPGIVKINDNTIHPNMWPIGHLYEHIASGTRFRFISAGASRGNPSFGISAVQGILCSTGYKDTQRYHFAFPASGAVVTHSDKNQLVQHLIKALR